MFPSLNKIAKCSFYHLSLCDLEITWMHKISGFVQCCNRYAWAGLSRMHYSDQWPILIFIQVILNRAHYVYCPYGSIIMYCKIYKSEMFYKKFMEGIQGAQKDNLHARREERKSATFRATWMCRLEWFGLFQEQTNEDYLIPFSLRDFLIDPIFYFKRPVCRK